MYPRRYPWCIPDMPGCRDRCRVRKSVSRCGEPSEVEEPSVCREPVCMRRDRPSVGLSQCGVWLSTESPSNVRSTALCAHVPSYVRRYPSMLHGAILPAHAARCRTTCPAVRRAVLQCLELSCSAGSGPAARRAVLGAESLSLVRSLSQAGGPSMAESPSHSGFRLRGAGCPLPLRRAISGPEALSLGPSIGLFYAPFEEEAPCSTRSFTLSAHLRRVSESRKAYQT